MKLLRKAVTFRSFLNRLLRKPQWVRFETTSTGLLIETQKYKNKTIIKVY
jgi:hypothetical protein